MINSNAAANGIDIKMPRTCAKSRVLFRLDYKFFVLILGVYECTVPCKREAHFYSRQTDIKTRPAFLLPASPVLLWTQLQILNSAPVFTFGSNTQTLLGLLQFLILAFA